jgi:hypothetical protein
MSEPLNTDGETSIPKVWAIDVHAHYGTYWRTHNEPLTNDFHSASADEVARRARAARIAWTVVSPLSGLLPRGDADAALGNTEAARIVPDCPGLLQWVVIDPTREATYSQAEEILKEPHCVGIKIHPEEHVYLFRDHGRRIFEFASKHRAVILTHSGEANSLPADIVEAANEFPDVRVILAHIGCSDSSDRTLQVRAILQSTRGNVYADTSSAMSMTPGLIEWAVGEVGADRVLFGTDAPLYATSMQRARINLADLDDNAKRRILRDNALSLLDIPETHATTAENR